MPSIRQIITLKINQEANLSLSDRQLDNYFIITKTHSNPSQKE